MDLDGWAKRSVREIERDVAVSNGRESLAPPLILLIFSLSVSVSEAGAARVVSPFLGNEVDDVGGVEATVVAATNSAKSFTTLVILFRSPAVLGLSV